MNYNRQTILQKYFNYDYYLPSNNHRRTSQQVFMKVILASRSPRRKKLLQQIGLQFEVFGSSVSEDYDESDHPSIIVQKLAHRKAADVARAHPHCLIIGADTIVWLDGRILEKPDSKHHAADMLKVLSGTQHQVYSGVALLKTGEKGNIHSELTFFEHTDVHFGEPDTDDIQAYIESGSPLDKAGAYGIQDDWGSLFVKRINGDYNTVVGFPLYKFYQQLKVFAPKVLPRLTKH